MKKIISILLSILILATTIPAFAIVDGITTVESTFKVVDTPNNTSAKGFRNVRYDGVPADNLSGCYITPYPENAPDYWVINGYSQLDITNPVTPSLTGIVKLSFDFKNAAGFKQFKVRLTANTSDGSALTWDSTSNTQKELTNSTYYLGKNKVKFSQTDWNHFSVIANYYDHKYYIYLNDTLAEEGTFKDKDGTTNQTVDARVIFEPVLDDSSRYNGEVCVDNFKLEEYRSIDEPANIVFSYSSGTETVYSGEALPAVNLTGIKFTLPVSLKTITTDDVKIIDSRGNQVEGFEFRHSASVITAFYNSAKLLPDGDYKLFISKNATSTRNNPIGVDLNYDFSVLSSSLNACILMPLENSSLTGKTVTLSAFVPGDAAPVIFCVNDEVVAQFEQGDGIYTYEYTPKELGYKTFEVFYNTPSGLDVVSETFSVTKTINTYKMSNRIESALSMASCAEGELLPEGGHDGSSAYVMRSKVGMLKDDGSVYTDISNSNTSAFAPNNYLYRKMINEFEMKVYENTIVFLEIGFSLAGTTISANNAAYTTLHMRGSRESNGLFDIYGNILGSLVPYQTDTWYRFVQHVDFDTMTCNWNVYSGENLDVLVLATSDDISGLAGNNGAKYPNWRDDIVITSKYKICLRPKASELVLPSDENPNGLPATLVVDNFSRYSPEHFPEVKSINGGTDNVVPGTEDVYITFTKPFDHDIVYPFDESLITVKVDGKVYKKAKVKVLDSANIKISGLDGVPLFSKVEVVVSDVAFFGGTTTDKEIIIPLYVTNENGFYIYPFCHSDISFAKYVNSGDTVNLSLALANYNSNGALNDFKVSPIAFESGSGIVSVEHDGTYSFYSILDYSDPKFIIYSNKIN